LRNQLFPTYTSGKREEEKGRRGEEEKGRKGEEEKGRFFLVGNLEGYFSQSRLLTENLLPFSLSPLLPFSLLSSLF